MKKSVLFVFLLNVTAVFSQYNETFADFINSKALSGANVGFSVIDIATGATVFSKNAEKFYYPASVQKVLTTTAALQLLGSAFHYETNIYYSGEIENGVLLGNLYVEAVGDPTIESEFLNNKCLEKLVYKLKNIGVTAIRGDLVFNNTTDYTPQSWLFEDIGNYYGVAPKLFNYKDNQYKINFKLASDGKHPKINNTSVPVPYTFDLDLLCKASEKRDNAYILGAPFSIERKVVGRIPVGVGDFEVKGANSFPEYTFRKELAREISLKEEHFKHTDKQLLLTIKSPKLIEIVKETMYQSNNLFAEALLYTLGLQYNAVYNAEGGISVLKQLVSEQSHAVDEIRVKDGSGLSRLNAMTPRFAADWLCTYSSNSLYKEMYPIAGLSGTMIYLSYPEIKGKVLAKSGSAEGVINYAGYIERDDGKIYSFALFINEAFQSRYTIRKEIGKLLAVFI